jgi:mannobiose 2-epimerase
MASELDSILSFWMKHMVDEMHDGFIGKLDHHNKKYPAAPKGSVMNSRMLWAFSAGARITGNVSYSNIATRAFQYLVKYFIDPVYGGVYWTVDKTGDPRDTKKQVYAISFAIYGMSEYYALTRNEIARETAISLYQDIIRYAYDENNGGYIEALTREWKEIADVRLSEKDANERKSMNTHLHVLEGFANLYKIWPDKELERRIRDLVNIFPDHIFSPLGNHLQLFFDEEWNCRSHGISYGHDIEAAWLVQEAAQLLGDDQLLEKVNAFSLKLVIGVEEGLDDDGGLWYEYDQNKKHLVKEKHWWPQAEAMIGFLHAAQTTDEEKYYRLSLQSWEFVKQHIQDKKNGEWVWGVYEDYSPMNQEDKAGIWKCPYHNTRACIEVARRIDAVDKKVKYELK